MYLFLFKSHYLQFVFISDYLCKMRSRSYDRTDLREAPVSRSRSLDVLLRKAVVHPFGSLADAKDKVRI